MCSKQENLFVYAFKNFDSADKFFAIEILKKLLIEEELYIKEIYFNFSNKKQKRIRRILKELEKNQLIQEIKKSNQRNKKIYIITNEGTDIITKRYNS